MRRILPFIFLFPLFLSAQEIDWAMFINGAGEELLDAIATDSEGNTYVGGYFDGSIAFNNEIFLAPGLSDGFLFKVSPEGEMLWHAVLGGSGVSRVTDIQFDKNGSLLVSGYFTEQLLYGNSLILEAEEFQWRAFMLWINPEGGLIQTEQVPCSNLLRARNFFQAADGSYYLTGDFRGTLEYRGLALENGPAGYPELFVLKLSPALDVLWHKHIKTNDISEMTGVAEGPDGSLFLTAGYSGRLQLEGITLNASSTTGSDGVVFKFSKFGELQWHQVVSGQNKTRFSSLSIDPFGDVYLTGVFGYDIVLDFLNASPEYPFNLFICKLRADNGAPRWLYTYSSESYNSGTCIRASPAGGFWLSGLYGGNFNLGGIPLDGTGEPSDGFLAKFDDDGTATWAQTITGPESDYLESFTVHPDGPLYAMATFRQSTQIGAFPGNAQDKRDIALFKARCPVNKPVITKDTNTLFTTENYAAYQWYKNGSPIAGNGAAATAQGPGQYQVAVESFTGCVTISDIVDVAVATEEVQKGAQIWVYPNPARERIHIAHWPRGKTASVRLLSLQGQELHRWASGQAASEAPLELPPLEPGIYLLELADRQSRQYHRLLIL